MRIKLIIPAVSIIALGMIILFYLWTELYTFYPEVLTSTRLVSPKVLIEDVVPVETRPELTLPPPINVETGVRTDILTINGVVEITNQYRLANSLPPFEVNSLLTTAADRKVQDMFENQYFAHESPTGVDVGKLIEDSGYFYIIVGENLAEGRFEGNEGVVEAWINSPGHRANILNRNFSEIGVGVGRGLWNGRDTWMAVQEFGLPLSTCDEPSKSLRAQIEDNKSGLYLTKSNLDVLKSEVESHNPSDWYSYNKKVKSYNLAVIEYNSVIEHTQDLIKTYNSQVKSFNSCFKKVTN